MKQVKKILRRATQLPPMPGVVTQILEIVADPDYSMDRLVRVVSLDPGLTANVLRMANSSFFGLRYKASSVEQALTYLGSNHLVEIVMSSGVSDYFKGSHEGYGLGRGELWRHSMATALIAARLAGMLGQGDQATVYTAGLLHDMGKLVLSSFMHEVYDKIEVLIEEEGWLAEDAERKVLGIDHAMLGGYVAKKWHLGDAIQKAVQFHHSPEKSLPPRQVTNLVSVANYLANVCGAPGGMGYRHQTPPPVATYELDIYPDQLKDLQEAMRGFLEKAEPLLTLAEAA